MTDEEFSELTKEYRKAHDEYHRYMKQFTSCFVDGIQVKKAELAFTRDKIANAKELRLRFNKIDKQWHEALGLMK